MITQPAVTQAGATPAVVERSSLRCPCLASRSLACPNALFPTFDRASTKPMRPPNLVGSRCDQNAVPQTSIHVETDVYRKSHFSIHVASAGDANTRLRGRRRVSTRPLIATAGQASVACTRLDRYYPPHISPLAVRPLDYPERVQNPWGFLVSGSSTSAMCALQRRV